MSLPDKCPFCGAARRAYWPGVCHDYTCGTSIHTKRDARRNQSHMCKEAERAPLAARVAELEAQNAQLQSELDYAKGRAKELEEETLRLEDLAKNRGKLMTQAVDESRELEARCKRMDEAARAVYIDSIVSDHPWTELETRNMHALRDVLEAKP